MEVEKDFIGCGWSFPPSFYKQAGTVVMLEGEEDINSSLHILVSTAVTERVMQPRYGCNLRQFIFEPANEAILFRIKKLVEDAILYFEPRIRLDRVGLTAEQTEGWVEITVEYTIKATNSRGNFVYPFYLKEG